MPRRVIEHTLFHPPLFLSRILLALSSAALLIASFPNFNQPWCAWIALVPWLILIRQLTTRQVFWWSWWIGFLFFLGSIWWLIHVTLLGWLILCAILACYCAAFGWFASRWTSVMARAAAWVALEYTRSHLFSGFGWNLLAYSQAPWWPVIQIADATGVWGVSFLIAVVNASLAAWLSKRQPSTAARLAGAVIAVLLIVGYGLWRIQHLATGSSIRVAVVQGNIPQEEKWDETYRNKIKTRYDRLVRQAAQTQPHLIIWPETATPHYLGLDEDTTQWVSGLARAVGVPMLVGAPMGHLQDMVWQWTNSAALVDVHGSIVQRHDKLHLVAFGEFVPFERTLPWLRQVLPPIGDFIPGREHTIFRPADPVPPFSVLICFEDIFPDLARRFVRGGAQWLLVITNDAWFGPTAAAYQHAQASTFRAVELRVPIARAANTGWSGCIDAAGRWTGSIRDAAGRQLFIEGTHTCELPLAAGQTLYRRFGDWFAWVCLFVAVGWGLTYNKSF